MLLSHPTIASPAAAKGSLGDTALPPVALPILRTKCKLQGRHRMMELDPAKRTQNTRWPCLSAGMAELRATPAKPLPWIFPMPGDTFPGLVWLAFSGLCSLRSLGPPLLQGGLLISQSACELPRECVSKPRPGLVCLLCFSGKSQVWAQGGCSGSL